MKPGTLVFSPLGEWEQSGSVWAVESHTGVGPVSQKTLENGKRGSLHGPLSL